MTVDKPNIKHAPSSSSTPTDHHYRAPPHISSVVETPHPRIPKDAHDNPQERELDLTVNTNTNTITKLNNSSTFPIDSLSSVARSSVALEQPSGRLPVIINFNDQVVYAPSLHTECLHSQQVLTVPRHLSSIGIDLEAQTASTATRASPPSPPRTTTSISASLNAIYTTNTGIFRLLGSVLVCAGVAFSLWQALESRAQL